MPVLEVQAAGGVPGVVDDQEEGWTAISALTYFLKITNLSVRTDRAGFNPF